MSNLTQISDTLRTQIEDLQTKSASTTKMTGNIRSDMITKALKQLKRTRNLLKTYEFTISDFQNQPNIQTHQSQAKEFEKTLNQLQKQFDYSRNEGANEAQLFSHRNKKEQNPNNRQQMIQYGNKMQAQSKDTLRNIVKDVYQMNQQADAVNLELDRQIEQLDKVYDDLNDTETTLKRAEKHLKYFARQIYTDKLMMCMIVLIIIAIIVIIVLSAMGKLPKAQIDTIK